DVKTVGENIITYTNLVNALNLAQDGDVIKLNKDAEISKDVTIKTGVTLDTNESDLSIKDKKTLTIDGKLYLNDGILDYTATGDEKAKVTLNGYIISNDEIPFNTYSIAGVYFQYFDKTDYYGITSIGNIASAIEQDDDSEVDLYGELSVGNIAISGTTDESAVVNVNDKLTAGTITLDLASIEFDDVFVGTVSNGAGSIAFDGTADDLIVTSSTKDDVKTLKVTGGFTPGSKKMVTVTGDVSFYGFVATPVVVDGNVKVIATSTIEETEIEDLTVNGSVLVDNEATLTVGVAQVLGTLTVADETDDNDAAGTFDVEDLFLGIVYKDVDEGYSAPSLASTATLVGDADISIMYVIAGSSFPEDLVDENTPAVELYVEGELWMTIYSFGTETSVTVDQIPVENVKFEGWATKEGGEGSDNTTVEFSKEKYYADIKYDVYEVKFVIAEGIDDVYLDGILVQGSSILGSYENQFVSAGTHTISYTLANGYTGEAKMLVDGKEVSGYTFTTEGEYEGVIYTITLQGIEKAPAETGSVVEEEGMDLTDILLIVLVVLIVIMAIIVALRMMRS
ncbi:MAG: hypothetical protein IJV90_02850, partial [Candidatus Methanomethylophilaceae archaeon]|nr:hypothetical protein [Candidatus Methanomethylophilaceae archaeon]